MSGKIAVSENIFGRLNRIVFRVENIHGLSIWALFLQNTTTRAIPMAFPSEMQAVHVTLLTAICKKMEQFQHLAIPCQRTDITVERRQPLSTSYKGGNMENNLQMIMGADAIARELGMSRRQVYGLIYSGVLPAVKLGGVLAIRKARLASWLESLEAATAH